MSSTVFPQLDGFDAPVTSREHDHLNRWPIAQEIYRIATTSPKEWSVRIGIYGDWGSGKSSILEFVKSLAMADNQIVLKFNPWQYNDTVELWQDFVEALDKLLRQHSPGWRGRSVRRLKKPARKLLSFFSRHKESILPVLEPYELDKPLAGIDILKSFFSYSKDDLNVFLNSVGDKRVLVLFDDLDRTNATLLPELLFAIKEVMDVPRISFCCAFDPVIVGTFLKEKYPNLDNGIQFLEKIIDYPKWLPEPSEEGLVSLALTDKKRYSSFVPDNIFRKIIRLLPPNPRSVRKFVRLMFLLKPQVDRHYSHELNWHAILPASVIKMYYPDISKLLLSNDDFWQGTHTLMLVGNENNSLQKSIDELIKNAIASKKLELSPSDVARLNAAINNLCAQVNWVTSVTDLMYQFNLGDSPVAVTNMEFDELFGIWRSTPSEEVVRTFCEQQNKKFGCNQLEVIRTVFDITLSRYHQSLQTRNAGLTQLESADALLRIGDLLGLIEHIIYANLSTSFITVVDPPRFKRLLDEFLSNADIIPSEPQASFRIRERKCLSRLVSEWSGDIEPIVEILGPFNSWHRDQYSADRLELHNLISNIALEILARRAIRRFSETGFFSSVRGRQESLATCKLIFDIDEALWNKNRAGIITYINENLRDEALRENLFEFLHYVKYLVRQAPDSDMLKSVNLIFGTESITKTIWNAVTFVHLSDHAAKALEGLPMHFQSLGVTVELPAWWNSA